MTSIQDISQSGRLLVGLQELYSSALMTDVVLVAGETEVACHRCVLASSSPYFRSMFSSNMIESREDRVELYNIASCVLGPLVSYFYTATVQLTEKTVQDMFSAANLLELIELQDICAQFLVKHMDGVNCAALYSFGILHSNIYLKSEAWSFMMQKFSQVVELGEVWLLDIESFSSLLGEDNLDIHSENVVFNAMVKWVQHDVTVRKKHLPDLLKQVRLGLLSQEYMARAYDLFTNDSFCHSVVSLALLNCNTQIPQVGDTDAQTRKRFGMQISKKLVIFIGFGHQKGDKVLACYDPDTKSNYYVTGPGLLNSKHRVQYHRAAVTENNLIFVAGGVLLEDVKLCVSGTVSREVVMFDPDDKSWFSAESMLQPRCAFSLVYFHNKLYAIGGLSVYPNGEPLSSVECYDLESDTWGYVAELPRGVHHHESLVYKDSILVIGGCTRQGVSSAIYTYTSDSWTQLFLSLGNPRAEFGAVIHNDKLFIVGGSDGACKLHTMEIVNLQTLDLKMAADFLAKRLSPAMFVLGDFIYLCGGDNTYVNYNGRPKEPASRDLWKYNPKTNHWTSEMTLVLYGTMHAYVIAEYNINRLVDYKCARNKTK